MSTSHSFQSPATVFVVDDDPGIRRLVEKTLRRSGHRLESAGSAAEAIEWLNAHEASLLLLDLKLPDAEGADIVNRLARLGRWIPFIVITGQGDERIAVEMMKRGAADYLVKDRDFIELLPSIVERVLARIQTEKRLAETEKQLRQAEKELLEAGSREQQRIGQDLHDGLGQHLAGIELLSQVLADDLAGDAPEYAAQAAKISERVRQAISRTRMLARGLSPVHIESEGLMSALQELAVSTKDIFSVHCRFRCPAPVPVNDNHAATHLYRIAQEATHNAIKHGQASRIDISLKQEQGTITLTIADDGRGLTESTETKGIGLRIMNRRAMMIGGRFEIRNRRSKGAKVICTFPEKS